MPAPATRAPRRSGPSTTTPDVNKLATQALSETDPAKRTQIYLKMQQQIHEDAPYLWLYWSPARTAIAKNVHGFKVLPTGNYWLEDVWKS